MIRFADKTTDLSLLSDQARELLDPSSILVYDRGGIKGLLVLFESSHKVLWLESLLTTSPLVALRLLQWVVRYAARNGYKAVVGVTPSQFVQKLALSHGATLDDQRVTFLL